MKKNHREMKLAHDLEKMAAKPAPLFHLRPGQQEPCPAYIVIRPRGWLVEAVADRCPSRYAVLAAHRGMLLRFSVPPTVSGEALYRFCSSHSIQALMRRVCAEWSAIEDANRDLHGLLSDAGSDALIELQARADRDLQPKMPSGQLSLEWQDEVGPAGNYPSAVRSQRRA
jgi:hypothetical protein